MYHVALRKESVDRNYKERPGQKARPKSLSARRAWIEIVMQEIAQQRKQVALRKESVDRNSIALASIKVSILVALRKESVDRNNTRGSEKMELNSRSPQGERG